MSPVIVAFEVDGRQYGELELIEPAPQYAAIQGNFRPPSPSRFAGRQVKFWYTEEPVADPVSTYVLQPRDGLVLRMTKKVHNMLFGKEEG